MGVDRSAQRGGSGAMAIGRCDGRFYNGPSLANGLSASAPIRFGLRKGLVFRCFRSMFDDFRLGADRVC